jgi:hypothetical protein
MIIEMSVRKVRTDTSLRIFQLSATYRTTETSVEVFFVRPQSWNAFKRAGYYCNIARSVGVH